MKSMCKILITNIHKKNMNIYFHMNLWYRNKKHFMVFFLHKLKIQVQREPNIQPTRP